MEVLSEGGVAVVCSDFSGEGWSLFLLWLSPHFVPSFQNYPLGLEDYLKYSWGVGGVSVEVGPSASE